MARVGTWGLFVCLLGNDHQIICEKYNDHQIISEKYNVSWKMSDIVKNKSNQGGLEAAIIYGQ